MNIEELKLILEAIAQLGTQGKEAFIWWVVLDRIPTFIVGMFALTVLGFAVNKLHKVCLESSQAHQDLRNIASLLGVGIADEYRFLWAPKLEKAILKLRDSNK